MAEGSKRKRWFVGCGLGCGGLLVFAVVGALLLVRWATERHELPPARLLLGASTEGYLRADLRPGDEELLALVTGGLGSIEGTPAGGLGEQAAAALPVRIEAYVSRPGFEGEAEPRSAVVLVSLSRYANMARLMLAPGLSSGAERYRGVRIGVEAGAGPGLTAICLVANSVVLASSSAAAHSAIDGLLDAPPATAANALATLGELVAGDGLLHGALANGSGGLPDAAVWLGRRLGATEAATRLAEALGAADGAAIAARLAGSELEGELALQFAGPEQAERAAGEIGEGLADLFEGSEPRLTFSAEARGSVVRVSFRSQGLAARLEQAVPR